MEEPQEREHERFETRAHEHRGLPFFSAAFSLPLDRKPRIIKIRREPADMKSVNAAVSKPHPLDSLDEQEVSPNCPTLLSRSTCAHPSILRSLPVLLVQTLAISNATRLFALTLADAPIHAVKHLTIALIPPPKQSVLAHLSIPLKTGDSPFSPAPTLSELGRRAESVFLDIQTSAIWELRLKLVQEGDAKLGDWVVESSLVLEEGVQSQLSPEELEQAEQHVRADERVRALAAEIGESSGLGSASALSERLLKFPPSWPGLLPEQISCDGWSIGYDTRFDKRLRLQQCLLFARFSEHSNLYAHPRSSSSSRSYLQRSG